MDLTAALVRLGSLVSVLAAAAALALLAAGGVGADGVPVLGLLATFALVAGAVAVAVAWGRRTAPARWETPYW
ncbi:hypothetical protein [Halobaculum magnesiiphilum]|uniref:Uncharacterized protein n=1 Tax=Halobaculum magnesiiphilum TaxID=1017351 RepID=A0A8T8WE25_9EURY|nr:hypothetical protein [Halobaculum magnesiiphilum]QZP38036.1 hypothetical protein K6T50_02420 [Halobaculum magnesiiphilum]